MVTAAVLMVSACSRDSGASSVEVEVEDMEDADDADDVDGEMTDDDTEEMADEEVQG